MCFILAVVCRFQGLFYLQVLEFLPQQNPYMKYYTAFFHPIFPHNKGHIKLVRLHRKRAHHADARKIPGSGILRASSYTVPSLVFRAPRGALFDRNSWEILIFAQKFPGARKVFLPRGGEVYCSKPSLCSDVFCRGPKIQYA